MRKSLHVMLAVALVVGALSGLALAHETKELGEWRVIFGMTPEPVFTDQFYKTTWRFVDGEGNPVVGLRNLSVTVLKDGVPYGPFTVSAAHGSPGLYETPHVFATAGEYRFVLTGVGPEGSATGNFSIEFYKEVHDVSVITVGG